MDDDANALDAILQCLSDNGYSIFTLVTGVLSQHNLADQRIQSAKEDLERNAVDICACFLSHAPVSASVSAWAISVTQSTLRSEIEEMTKKKHSLRFSATTATTEQIELTFMPQLAAKIRLLAPSLWGLVFALLGALDDRRMSDVIDPLTVDLSELFAASEEVTGDLGGDEEAEDNPLGDDGDPEVTQNGERQDERRPRKRSRKDVSVRNTTLRIVVSYMLSQRVCTNTRRMLMMRHFKR